MKKIPLPDIGFWASGLVALLGYFVGAPVEAVIVLVIVGTTIEYMISHRD